MSDGKLHPSVQQFKQFVKEHPLLIKEVRSGNKTWQELYEEWIILGEHHVNWESYKKNVQKETVDSSAVTAENTSSSQETEGNSTDQQQNTSQSDTVNNLLALVKNINLQDLQGHVAQFSSALGNIQQLIQAFQGNKGPQQPTQQQHQTDPFSFRRH